MRAPFAVLALVLVFAAPAYAGSSASNITVPSDPSFFVDNGSDTMLVSGHTDFGDIDIICTYGPDDKTVDTTGYDEYNDVPRSGNGDFAVVLRLEPLRYEACRLHAVPHGDPFYDLATLTGPGIGVAYRTIDTPTSTYQLQLAPHGGFADFRESADCGGIYNTYAEDPPTFGYGQAFGCADSLRSPPDPDNGRAAVQVDGKDAYFNYDLHGVATNFPANPQPSLNVDTSTGLGSVSAPEGLAVCQPGGSFPPVDSTCHDAVSSGVRLDHSANLTDNGALALVNEQFTSTDGAAHTVDVWFRQSSGGGTTDWKFPGDPAFRDYSAVTGRTVPSGPATALLYVEGVAYGSFSWSDTPDAVRFRNGDVFSLHYTFTVPAGGSHTLRFAYGTGFNEAAVAALGAEAVERFTPVVGAPPIGPPTVTPPPPLVATPRLKFSAKAKGDGSVTVTFNAPGAGSLSGLETAVVPVSAKKKTKKLTVARARKKVTRAGTVKLVLKLNRKGKKLFRAKHTLRTTLALSFKPTVGSATKLAPKHLTLKLKKHRRKH
jgi:hypothetical protein